MKAWWFWLVRFSQRLIVRAGAYGAFAVLTALAAVWLAPLVPTELADRLGGPAVENILSALASSLLAVSTFSVSAVVVAYTAVSAQLTPRAAAFITNDGATQRALATFVGAFLFAVVALVALGASYYGPAGRTILFLSTLLMVALVAITLLIWIDRVARLAQHGHLLKQIEETTLKALRTRMKKPFLGGYELGEPSEEGAVLGAPRAGYLGNIDPHQLQAIGDRLGTTVEILAAPGDFIRQGATLVRLPQCAALAEDDQDQLHKAFVFVNARTHEQDPRYGLQVLVEAAARALSPGVNDPGTAVLATDACYRVLATWADRSGGENAPTCPRLRARGLASDELVGMSLGEIGRYGARDVAVASHVIASLNALARQAGDVGASATVQAAVLTRRVEAAIDFEPDLQRFRAAATRAEACRET